MEATREYRHRLSNLEQEKVAMEAKYEAMPLAEKHAFNDGSCYASLRHTMESLIKLINYIEKKEG